MLKRKDLQVGDRVRVVKLRDDLSCVNVGDILTVRDVYDESVDVIVPDEPLGELLYYDEIEKVTDDTL